MKHLYLILFLLLPILVFAQSDSGIPGSYYKTDCDGKIFELAETLPSLKGGKTALSDSLSLYLKNHNAVFKDCKVVCTMLITTKSQIFDLSLFELPQTNQYDKAFWEGMQILKSGVLTYSCLWIPAVQNFRNVCADIVLEVEFANGVISLKVRWK